MSQCLAVLDGPAVASFHRPVLYLEDVHRRLGELLALLGESGGGELRVDLGEVELLTAGGVGGLVELRQAVDAAGGRLALTGIGGMVYEVLRLCGLLEVLDVQSVCAAEAGSFGRRAGISHRAGSRDSQDEPTKPSEFLGSNGENTAFRSGLLVPGGGRAKNV